MKRFVEVITISTLSLLLAGCGKLDVEKTYFPDGSIMAEKHIRGKTTLTRAYHPNGTLIGEYRHKDGERHGQTKMYYNTGELFKVVDYRDGKIKNIKQYSKAGLLMLPE